MVMIGQRIETPNSIVELARPGLVIQRYLSQARTMARTLDRDRVARWKLAGRGRYALLLVLPSGFPVQAPLLNEDHFRRDSVARRISALAVVTGDTAMHAAMKLYFRYFAQSFEARVFDGEVQARAWLDDKIDDAMVGQ